MANLSTAGHDATVMSCLALPGGHTMLRLQSPALAESAYCGSYFSIAGQWWPTLRVDTDQGWIELYCHDHAPTLHHGEIISLPGPHGEPLVPDPARPRVLLLGEGPGIGVMVHLADQLRRTGGYLPLVLLATANDFPFQPRPSRFIVPGVPAEMIAAMPLLEDWGIASRLCCPEWLPGCHEGTLVELTEDWLVSARQIRDRTMLLASVSLPVRAHLEALAAHHDVVMHCTSLLD